MYFDNWLNRVQSKHAWKVTLYMFPIVIILNLLSAPWYNEMYNDCAKACWINYHALVQL